MSAVNAEDVEMTATETPAEYPAKVEMGTLTPPAPVPSAEVASALAALESLASVSSPLGQILDVEIATAKSRLITGEDAKAVIQDLQKSLVKGKKEVEKGLKEWYGHLGKIGKQVDKVR